MPRSHDVDEFSAPTGSYRAAPLAGNGQLIPGSLTPTPRASRQGCRAATGHRSTGRHRTASRHRSVRTPTAHSIVARARQPSPVTAREDNTPATLPPAAVRRAPRGTTGSRRGEWCSRAGGADVSSATAGLMIVGLSKDRRRRHHDGRRPKDDRCPAHADDHQLHHELRLDSAMAYWARVTLTVAGALVSLRCLRSGVPVGPLTCACSAWCSSAVPGSAAATAAKRRGRDQAASPLARHGTRHQRPEERNRSEIPLGRMA
jgi:hypothetical protein